MKRWRTSPAVFLPVFVAVGMLLAVIAFTVLHNPEEKLTDAGRIAPFFIGGLIGLAVWALVFNWRDTFLGGGQPWS